MVHIPNTLVFAAPSLVTPVTSSPFVRGADFIQMSPGRTRIC